MLHGAIFLFPVALATLAPALDDGRGLARGWIAVFAIEIVLYVVGAAFIVLILAKDRTVHAYKLAATTDPLTSVLNRRGFFDTAAVLLSRSLRRRASVSVLAFDLDRFKSINDDYGHAMGDAVLQLFAKVLQQTLRASDVIGRLGGEEFIALLPATLAEATIAAERVRTALAAQYIVQAGREITATVSIGVACGPPSTAIDVLIARADAALYHAKTSGRNRVETVAQKALQPQEAGAEAEQDAAIGALQSCVI
jgi:diguanylate cyclase (GGDEF)-like protein